jgi:hypothetical protein
MNSRRRRAPIRAGKALKHSPMKIRRIRKCSNKETHNRSWEKEKVEETLSIRLLPILPRTLVARKLSVIVRKQNV